MKFETREEKRVQFFFLLNLNTFHENPNWIEHEHRENNNRKIFRNKEHVKIKCQLRWAPYQIKFVVELKKKTELRTATIIHAAQRDCKCNGINELTPRLMQSHDWCTNFHLMHFTLFRRWWHFGAMSEFLFFSNCVRYQSYNLGMQEMNFFRKCNCGPWWRHIYSFPIEFEYAYVHVAWLN